MTTVSTTINFDSTTDIKFREWGARIRQSFLDAGLVQTADTGQTNWATVTRNIDGNQGERFPGNNCYEIFRFNDPLQASAPIFVKVEYGTVNVFNSWHGGTPQPTAPVLFVTVGTGTNGAGTILNPGNRHRWVGCEGGGTASIQNQASPTYSNQGPSSGTPLDICGVPGHVGIMLGATAQQQPFTWVWTGNTGYWRWSLPALLFIERSCDSSGNPTGEGFIVGVSKWGINSDGNSLGARPLYQAHSFAGGAFGVSPVDGYLPIAMPGQGYSTANFDGDAYFFPLPRANPKPQPQSLAVLGTYKGDVPLRTVQQVQLLGSTHSYLSLAGIAGDAATDNTRSRFWDAIPNGALLMRWE